MVLLMVRGDHNRCQTGFLLFFVKWKRRVAESQERRELTRRGGYRIQAAMKKGKAKIMLRGKSPGANGAKTVQKMGAKRDDFFAQGRST